MVIVFVYCTALVLLLASERSLGQSYKVVCYYTSWSQYRTDEGKFLPENVDPDLCTHLIYAYAKVENDIIQPYDWNDESRPELTPPFRGLLERVSQLKTKAPGLKTMIGVGGRNHQHSTFSQMISTASSRRTFLDSVAAFIEKYNLDGMSLEFVDIWKNSEGRMLYNSLIKEAYRKFNKTYLLSVAVSPNKTVIDASFDVPELARNVDFLNVMAIDLHSSTENVTAHHSPLGNLTTNSETENQLNQDWAIRYWVEKGAPSTKLILTCAAFGVGYTLTDSLKTGICAPTSGSSQPGTYTRGRGIMAYYEVCQKLSSMSLWRSYWLNDLNVPYAAHSVFQQWIGYDNPSSIKHKASYVKRNRLAGVALWALDFDDFNGHFCQQGMYPLLRAFWGVLNSTDNFTSPEIVGNGSSHCLQATTMTYVSKSKEAAITTTNSAPGGETTTKLTTSQPAIVSPMNTSVQYPTTNSTELESITTTETTTMQPTNLDDTNATVQFTTTNSMDTGTGLQPAILDSTTKMIRSTTANSTYTGVVTATGITTVQTTFINPRKSTVRSTTMNSTGIKITRTTGPQTLQPTFIDSTNTTIQSITTNATSMDVTRTTGLQTQQPTFIDSTNTTMRSMTTNATNMDVTRTTGPQTQQPTFIDSTNTTMRSITTNATSMPEVTRTTGPQTQQPTFIDSTDTTMRFITTNATSMEVTRTTGPQTQQQTFIDPTNTTMRSTNATGMDVTAATSTLQPINEDPTNTTIQYPKANSTDMGVTKTIRQTLILGGVTSVSISTVDQATSPVNIHLDCEVNDSLRAHPTDCTSYFNCKDNMELLARCTLLVPIPGFVHAFSAEIGGCIFVQMNSTCPPSNSTPHPTQSTQATTEITTSGSARIMTPPPTQSTQSTTSGSARIVVQPECTNSSAWRELSDCTKFKICINNTITTESCASLAFHVPGLKFSFSEVHGMCVLQNKTLACGGSDNKDHQMTTTSEEPMTEKCDADLKPYPDDEDCKLFYYCSPSGRLTKRSCPQPLNIPTNGALFAGFTAERGACVVLEEC